MRARVARRSSGRIELKQAKGRPSMRHEARGRGAAPRPRPLDSSTQSKAGPSKEVIELRQNQHRCNVTEEPPRYLVFTRQRSGSRWFVNTISELGGEMGKTQFHYLPSLRELGLDGNGFMRFVNAARESGLYATACKHPKPSPECVCLLRHVYSIKEHSKINNMNRAIGWKWMVKFQDSPRHNPFRAGRRVRVTRPSSHLLVHLRLRKADASL